LNQLNASFWSRGRFLGCDSAHTTLCGGAESFSAKYPGTDGYSSCGALTWLR